MPECVIDKESVFEKIRKLDKVSGCAAYDCDEVENIILNEPEIDVVTLEYHENAKKLVAKKISREVRFLKKPGVFIPNFEMPCCCNECVFRANPEEIRVDWNLYKKISRCLLAPENIEDPWRDVMWQVRNREDFCPLVEIKGVSNNDT